MDHRPRSEIGVAKSAPGGGLKGHIGGIYGMIGPVVDHHLDTGNGKFELGTLLQGLAEALFTGRDVLGRDSSADDIVFKNEISLRGRLYVAGYPAVLPGAAGLFLVDIVEIGPLGNRFAIGNPGISGSNLGGVFPSHALHIHIEMQLPHAGNDRFVCFPIHVAFEGGVFFGEPGQGFGHIDLGLVVLWDDGQGNDRCGNIHGGHGQVQARRYKGIAGGTLDTEQGADISRRNGVDVFHLIGMHPGEPADLDLFPRADVHDGRSLGDGSLIDPDVGQLSERTVFKLERQSDNRLIRGIVQDYRRFVFIEIQGAVFHLRRAGQ